MTRTTKLLVGGAVAAVVAAGAVAATTTAGDDDIPITGDAYDRATEAALAHVGGGSVIDTEIGDEEGAYEVEVVRSDGTRVDVHLGADFAVLGTEEDGADEDDAD